MRKKVSVEIWDRYNHYLTTVKLELKEKFGMEVTNVRKCGSIFGYLDDTHFTTVENKKEIIGVFEVELLPDELPLLPGKIAGTSTEATIV
jgi:hypothetical protein